MDSSISHDPFAPDSDFADAEAHAAEVAALAAALQAGLDAKTKTKKSKTKE